MSIFNNMSFTDAFTVKFPSADGTVAATTNTKREPMTNGKANRLIKELLFSDERFGQWFVHDLHKLADDLTDKLDLPNAVLPWAGSAQTITSTIGGLTASGSVTITERGIDDDGRRWMRYGNGEKTYYSLT